MLRLKRLNRLAWATTCLLASCLNTAQSQTSVQSEETAPGVKIASSYKIDTLHTGLNRPWSLAFLPDDRMLITELGGQLRLIEQGELLEKPVSGVPEVYFAGQGGLMDVMVDQNFAVNQRLFISYAHGDRRGNATRVMSAKLVNNTLQDQQVIFTASPLKATAHHYGARMAQLPDNTILLAVGDGFNYREEAQKLDNHLGKIVRFNADGSVPTDNPWVNDDKAKPEIWSIGHRNQQALLVSSTGAIYENEHGPQGGDEINQIQPGNNYGWPAITYGIDYNGASITPYTEYPGMQQPIVNWTPSIAPAGMTEYHGALFPEWNGDLFSVALKQKSVRRVRIKDGKQISDTVVFPELGQRMRDIRTGPDGALYILTDGENGTLLRITR